MIEQQSDPWRQFTPPPVPKQALTENEAPCYEEASKGSVPTEVQALSPSPLVLPTNEYEWMILL